MSIDRDGSRSVINSDAAMCRIDRSPAMMLPELMPRAAWYSAAGMVNNSRSAYSIGVSFVPVPTVRR